MRKLLCLLISLTLCIGVTLPALAAESSLFIPSYGLEVNKATMDGEDVLECVTVTSVTEAKEKSTDITQEERDLLVEVYDALSNGTMKLPVEGEYIWLELMDVSFALEGCREKEDHEHKDEYLKEDNTALTMEFQMEIRDYAELIVLTYIDEKWEIVENVTDNGNDTVTITFQDICPVAIITREGESESESAHPGVSADFVPSISYKDGPTIEDATMDGEGVDECVVVTTIEQAEEKSTDISQEDRDLLLEVYEELKDGTMTLPLDDEYVIVELVDVSFEYEDCRQIEEHGHKDEHLKEDGVTLTVTFDLEIGSLEDIVVLVYIDGEWVPIKSVVNNGDGTITCIFEDICPVAFVKMRTTEVPKTGDEAGNQLMLVMTMMVISAAGIVTLLGSKARKIR